VRVIAIQGVKQTYAVESQRDSKAKKKIDINEVLRRPLAEGLSSCPCAPKVIIVCLAKGAEAVGETTSGL